MEWEYIQIPGVDGIRIKGVPFNRGETAPMSSRVDISSIFHFDRFREALYQSPEFALDVILSLAFVGVDDWVKGHLGREIILLEMIRLLLELFEGVDATFFKPKLARADQALGAVPVVLRDARERWIKAVLMVAKVTTIADNY